MNRKILRIFFPYCFGDIENIFYANNMLFTTLFIIYNFPTISCLASCFTTKGLRASIVYAIVSPASIVYRQCFSSEYCLLTMFCRQLLFIVMPSNHFNKLDSYDIYVPTWRKVSKFMNWNNQAYRKLMVTLTKIIHVKEISTTFVIIYIVSWLHDY